MCHRLIPVWGLGLLVIGSLFAPARTAAAADKAKAPKKTDTPAAAPEALPPPAAFEALEEADADGNVKPLDKNQKRAAAKAKKEAAAAKKKNAKNGKQLQQGDEAANEAAMLQQMQQAQQMQQMQMQQLQQMQGLAGGAGGSRQRRGNNAYNNGMFLMMQQFDANGNGQLDPQELQAMKLSMAQMQAGGPNVAIAGALQKFDADGDGQLSPSELQRAQAAMGAGTVGPQVGGGTTLPNLRVPPKVR